MSRNLFAFRGWLILVVSVISLVGAPAQAQGAAVVRVEPSAVSAQVNDAVTLSIMADNMVSLTAFELHLSFDPNVLEVTDVVSGGFVAADFVAQNIHDNAAGTIDYAAAQMNRTPAQGSGALLRIVFRAKAGGASSVGLRGTQAVPSGLILSDPNGAAIQASWVSGAVNVGSPATATATLVTPTPVTPTLSPTPVTPGPASPTPITPAPVTATPVTPAPATLTPQPSGSILGTHVVRWGETLYCIGRAYKVSPWAIADTNKIWWPYIIFPAQKLSIPNVPWSPIPAGPVCQAQFAVSVPVTPSPTVSPATPVPTAVPTATPIPSSTCRAYYVVRSGDTLYRIGTLYGVSYTEIARVNQISNPRLIYAGQKLCIP